MNPKYIKARKFIALCVSATALGCVGCEIVAELHKAELRRNEAYESLKAESENSWQQPESSGLGDGAPRAVPSAN
jgi:hypothetical protein